MYHFEVRAKKGQKPTYFTVDLKNGNGQAKKGKIEGLKADCTFVMLDDDIIAMSQGKLDGDEKLSADAMRQIFKREADAFISWMAKCSRAEQSGVSRDDFLESRGLSRI